MRGAFPSFRGGLRGSFRHRAVAALLVGSAGLAALPGGAHAQGVGYAELEEVFGEPITTSVTGKPQRASEAPAALVIITRDDIRRSPARDVPGIVQAYAGIDVARWTQGQADIAVRGGVQPYNPSLLVLVNGRQVYLDHYGVTNWAGIGVQLDEIQQIEVVKGPNSALFGFNAVSGVINIITIDPRRTQRVNMTAGIGTDGQRFASGLAAVKLTEGLGLRLSAGYDETDQLDGLATSAIAPAKTFSRVAPRHYEASGELYATLGDRTEAGVSVTHSNSRRMELPMLPVTIPAFYRFTSAGAHLSHDAGWGVLSARALRNWSDFRAESVKPVDFHNEVTVLSADALIPAGTANTFRLGAEYRSNQIATVPGYPGKTHYRVFAASGMWETEISDTATFTAAARVDSLKLRQEGEVDQPTIFTKAEFDRSITDWSFSSALRLELDDRNSLRFTASRGLQAPSFTAFSTRYDYSDPGLPASVFSGNPYIEPATVWSAEVGLTRALDDDGSRLELTGFYNRTNDIISPAGAQTPPRAAPPEYPIFVFTADNVGWFQSYGMEASLSKRLSPAWLLSFNYTWTHIDQHVPANESGVIARPLALDQTTPAHKVKAQVSYRDGPWLATVAARYTSATRQLVQREVPIGPLSLAAVNASLAIDAKLAVKVSDRLTLSVAGENLTGAAGAHLSPAAAERRLRASVTVGF